MCYASRRMRGHTARLPVTRPTQWVLGLALAVAAISVVGCDGDDDRQVAPAPVRNPKQAKSLAVRYQPILILEKDDDFWPIPVPTIDLLRSGGDGPCLRQRVGAKCDPISVDELPWGSGPRQAFIDYPAKNTDPEAQSNAMVQALGSSDLGARALLYFYVTGRTPGRPISLQYWFYYLYNYLPVQAHHLHLFNTDLHEGDFEGMSILLSARTHKPVYVWMPRHTAEGERYVWNEGALERRRDDHPVGYVAHGSHATYSSCGRKFRTIFKGGVFDPLPDDEVDCAKDDLYKLGPTVPVLNLARTWWACWPGHFGFAPGHDKYVGAHFANGPESPLFQQKFDLRNPEPCAKVSPPDRSASPQGALTDSEVAKQLGLNGGRLDSRFRDCYDWFQRPPAGSYMVACDRDTLDAFFASGLEHPGHQNLRILGNPSPTGPTVPAVYESSASQGVDRAVIRTQQLAQPEVYVAVRDGTRLKTAEFERFELSPEQKLQLRRPNDDEWLLADLAAGGKVVASAPVRISHAASEPSAPAIVSAIRRQPNVQLRFRGGTDPGTHLVALAGSSRKDLDEGGRPIGSVRAEPPGTYLLTIPDPDRVIHFVRILAIRDGAVAASAAAAVSDAP
jgi:hypothetical protein